LGLLVKVQIAFYQLVISEKNHLGARKIVDFSEQLKFLRKMHNIETISCKLGLAQLKKP
jgi:hypothetical protein